MIVYKYPLPLETEACIEMPSGAQVLSVQAQRGRPMVWALVDVEAPPATHWFHVCGTGIPVAFSASNPRFLGTFQLEDGFVMVHVWYSGETHTKSAAKP